MTIFIDIRSLDARYTSGVPGYVKMLIEKMLENQPNDEFIFFANSFRRNLEKTDLPQRYKGTWLNPGIPNRLFDLSNHILNIPKIDKMASADVFFSPHFNILSFRNPKRHVMTIHDISFVHHPDFFSGRKRFWHWQQNWREQIDKAGRIIVNSDFTAGDIAKTLQIESEKISRVYPGVNESYSKLPKNELRIIRFRNERGLNRPFILSIGTLEPRKNHVALIRAFNFLKRTPAFRDLELIIAGPRGWLYDKILREAETSPFRTNIRIWGRATPEEMLCLYNSASVFAYPSFFEGFGFPPLEAQACGLPVIASNRSSLPEILGDSALLIDPWRVGELALALESALSDRKTSEALIARGNENVKRFDWDKAAREVGVILKEQSSL